MNTVSIRLPVKITLFGEHAVVYNKPAIASTIPVFMNVTGRRLNDEKLVVKFHNANVLIKGIVLDRLSNSYTLVPDDVSVSRFTSYIVTGLEICEDELKVSQGGYEINIESTLPMGAGLGTSAAISVGTIAVCISLNYSHNFEDPYIKRMIALLAWKTERRVQGAASPMDTFTITYGGIRYIKPWIPEAEIIVPPRHFNIVIGYTPKRYTTADLVRSVKNLKSKEEYLLNMLLDITERVVEEAKNAIANNDIEKLGILMNINHGILESLGVVSLEHSNIVKTLIAAGALGAKTSGAGGGGAFIALARDREHAALLKNVAEALGAKVVALELYEMGFTINYNKME
ncbi:MAG: mevalonate kinase [Ignisphaera sp.]